MIQGTRQRLWAELKREVVAKNDEIGIDLILNGLSYQTSDIPTLRVRIRTIDQLLPKDVLWFHLKTIAGQKEEPLTITKVRSSLADIRKELTRVDDSDRATTLLDINRNNLEIENFGTVIVLPEFTQMTAESLILFNERLVDLIVRLSDPDIDYHLTLEDRAGRISHDKVRDEIFVDFPRGRFLIGIYPYEDEPRDGREIHFIYPPEMMTVTLPDGFIKITATFNRLIYSTYPPDAFRITLQALRADAPALTPMFEGDYNCLLALVRKHLEEKQKKRITARTNRHIHLCDSLNEKHFKNGVAATEIDEIARKLEIHITVLDASAKLWYDAGKAGTKRFTILCSNRHASEYSAITFCNDHPETVVCIDTALEQNTEYPISVIGATDAIIGFKTRTRNIRQNPFKCDGFYDPDEYAVIVEDKKYSHCYSKKSVEIADMELQQHFRASFDIIKNADYSYRSVSFDNASNIRYGADVNGAFYSFLSNRYYAKYRFPRPAIDCYQLEPAHNYEYLEHTGFSVVNNIKILPNTHNYLIQTCALQEGCIYANVLLRFYLDNDQYEFDIIATLYNKSNRSFGYHFEQTYNLTEEARKRRKIKYTDLIGSTIVRDRAKRLLIKSDNPADIAHIIYSQPDITKATTDTVEYVTGDINKSYRQHYGMHSYILAYMRITLLTEILKVRHEDIVTVNCDAIYSRSPLTAIPYGLKFGEFKRETRDLEKKQHPFVHNADLTQTPVDVSALPFMNDTIRDLPNCLSITGGPGSGKTYRFTEQNKLFDTCILTPTRELAQMFRDKGFTAFTYHKYINMNTARTYYIRYSTMIFDEFGCVDQPIATAALLKAKQDGSRVITTSDKYQLRPRIGYFTESPAYKELDNALHDNDDYFMFERLELTNMHRYDDTMKPTIAKLRKIVTSIPIVDTSKMKVFDIMSTYLPYVQAQFDLFDDTKHIKFKDIPANSDVVSPTNMQKSNFTKCSTIHSTQGKTYDSNLYIDCRDLTKLSFDPYLFYVAVSRCSKLEYVKLIIN